MQNLIPTLIFYPRKQLHTVLILEDALAKPLAWNPIATELSTGLQQRGITVLHGQFYGSLRRFYTAQGTPYDLNNLPNESNTYLLLIFSDGKSLREQHDAATLKALSHWQQVAWLELRETRTWDESVTLPVRFGLPIYPATAEGLSKAIGYFLSEYAGKQDFTEAAQNAQGLPVQIDDNLAAYLKELLGDEVLPWAMCCAMLQPVSLGLADALRCRFFADLPPEHIERLFALPNTINTVNGLHFAKPIIAILRQSFLHHFTKAKQRKILQFILKKLTGAKPKDEQSPAYLAWEWRYQRVNLELDPDEALQRLSELAHTPLGQAIKEEFDNTVPQKNSVRSTKWSLRSFVPYIPLRLAPKTQKARSQQQYLLQRSLLKLLGIKQWATIGLPIACALWMLLLSRESYVMEQPHPPYNIELINADGVLAWGIVQNDGSFTAVTPRKPLTLPSDYEHVTFLNHNGFIKNTPALIGKLTDNSRIELGYDDKTLSCLEHFPEIGLTVQRCIEDTTSSPLVMPTWYASLKEAASQTRFLSIGLEIQTNPTDDPALQVLRHTFLETQSVDIFYRIAPAPDDELYLSDALAEIQMQLAPWQKNSQFIGWVVGNNASDIQIDDFIASFGSGLMLAQRRDLSWVASVQHLFTASESPIISAAEIGAALGKQTEQVAFIRQQKNFSSVALSKNALDDYNLAQLREKQGKLSEAQKLYTRVIKVAPEFAPAYVNLARLLEKQGKLAEAQWLYNRAIKAEPKFALAYAGLGDVLMQRQDYWQAAEMFQKFLTLQETSNDPALQPYLEHYTERFAEAKNKIIVFATEIFAAISANRSFGPLRADIQVQFPINSDMLTKQVWEQTQEMAKAINGVFAQSDENTRIRIEGHTDNVGRAADNKKLSERRANSVKNVLVNDFNIPADRLAVVGWGEEKPIATNKTEHGRFKNRRITLIRLDK